MENVTESATQMNETAADYIPMKHKKLDDPPAKSTIGTSQFLVTDGIFRLE